MVLDIRKCDSHLNLREAVCAYPVLRGTQQQMLCQAVAIPRPPRGLYSPAVELGLTFGDGGPTTSARRPANGPHDDDVSLVASVAQGDSRALEQLYERHSVGACTRWRLRLLSDAAAADVVQETFLKLWRQPNAYQPGRGRLLAWLLGTASPRYRPAAAAASWSSAIACQPSPHANGDGLVDLLDSFA